MRRNHIPTPAELESLRRSYIPADSRDVAQRITGKRAAVVAWQWICPITAAPYAVAFVGRSQYPTNTDGRGRGGAFWFRSLERRRDWIARVFRGAELTAQFRATREADKAAARAKPHALQVGDVLRSSWGYDQTNVDYYEVTRLVGAQMVEITKISQQSQETGSMVGECVPLPGAYIGQPRRVRVHEHGNRDSVRVSSYADAYLVSPTFGAAGIRCYPPARWTAYA